MLGRKKFSTPTEIVPIDNKTSELILSSIEKSRLDLTQVKLVGSAALALYGVELQIDPMKNDLSSRPGDVDFITHPEYFGQLSARPDSNLKDSRAFSSQLIQRIDGDGLPIDIITSFDNTKHNVDKFTRAFHKNIASSPLVAGTQIRVASPDDLHKELRKNATPYDPKTVNDLRSFDNTFRK